MLAWAVAVLPNLSIRSFIWEEGTCAELARNILAQGNLTEPAVYSVRWVENPSLLPLLIAGVARLMGQVNEWSARIPGMAAVLITAFLVLKVTSRWASERAGFFAAMAFLFCPLLLRKLTIAEPDTVITALEFGAFAAWLARSKPGLWQGLISGILLATAAMAKGPQPIAFFVLGIGGYVLWCRRWEDLGPLFLALALPSAAFVLWVVCVYQPGDLQIWLGYMRLSPRMAVTTYLAERGRFGGVLLLDLLPAILLLPSFWKEWRRGEGGAEKLAHAEVCIWFASAATLVLFFWPGANTRYAMPAAPAIAVMAGLAFDRLWEQRHYVVRSAVAVLVALVVYQLALVWVIMPAFAPRFGANRAAGSAIAQIIGTDPAPIYNAEGPHTNQLFYSALPIRWIHLAEAAEIRAPAWLILTPEMLHRLQAQFPRFKGEERLTTPNEPRLTVVRINADE